MIVSWFVDRGMRSESGLLCTSCNCSFKVSFKYFYTDFNDFVVGNQPDILVYCPRCGRCSLYPKPDINLAYENYLKYKKNIEG